MSGVKTYFSDVGSSVFLVPADGILCFCRYVNIDVTDGEHSARDGINPLIAKAGMYLRVRSENVSNPHSLNCLFIFFIRSKLEFLTRFPASK